MDEIFDATDNPLIRKIKAMLERTAPSKWIRYDTELNQNMRFEKPRKTWERVYTLSIPNGTLVLRASTPVRSDYVAGGNVLSPIGPEKYLTEIRAAGWDGIELVDPYKQGGVGDKKVDVLAEGRVAQELFVLVSSQITDFLKDKQGDFNHEVEQFLSELPKKLPSMKFEHWQKVDDEKGGRTFTAKFENTIVDVIRDISNSQENYYIVVKRGNLTSRSMDWSLAKNIYEGIEKLEQHSGLLALSKVLGLDDEK